MMEVLDKLALAIVLYMQWRIAREQRLQAQHLTKMGQRVAAVDDTVQRVQSSLRPRRIVQSYDPDKTPQD